LKLSSKAAPQVQALDLGSCSSVIALKGY
jgi:hypothetical protein